MQPELQTAGVETLGVVNTTLDRARLYFRYRPARMSLAADPEASTHRAYGVPAFQIGETSQWPFHATPRDLMSLRVNPTGELPEALPLLEAAAELNRREGFQSTEVDEQVAAAHGTQLDGYFLLDREGIVRWTHIEAAERMTDLGKFPTEKGILAAARALPT
jgi:hypothetical protein